MTNQELAQQAVDHTAAWLAFIGALTVATIAAGTAQWRQRSQLRHDRELKDLDELRALLDACAQAVASASHALLVFLNRAYVAPRQGADENPQDANAGEDETVNEDTEEGKRTDELDDEHKHEGGHTHKPEDEDEEMSLGARWEEVLASAVLDSDASPEELEEAEEALLEAAKPIFGLYQRVVLRLGEGHEIALWLLALQSLYSTVTVTDVIGSTEPNSRERFDQLAAIRHDARERHFGFLHAARALVGSRIRGTG